MGTEQRCEVVVTLAWWWRLYFFATIVATAITGREPTRESLDRFAARAVRAKVRDIRTPTAREHR